MLFSREDKNVLYGAVLTSVVDGALEGYYAWAAAQNINLRDPSNPIHFLYYVINPWIPPMDDIIALDTESHSQIT